MANEHVEMLDIINENDEVIGQATRENYHNDPNLLHRTVHFTLYNKATQKFLLTQRSYKKKHDAGKFCFLGEHLQVGENYEQAIRRGVAEELGIAEVCEFSEKAQNFFSYQKERELVRFYLVIVVNAVIAYDPDEVEQVLWLTVDELRNSNLDISEMTKYWIDNINWY